GSRLQPRRDFHGSPGEEVVEDETETHPTAPDSSERSIVPIKRRSHTEMRASRMRPQDLNRATNRPCGIDTILGQPPVESGAIPTVEPAAAVAVRPTARAMNRATCSRTTSTCHADTDASWFANETVCTRSMAARAGRSRRLARSEWWRKATSMI